MSIMTLPISNNHFLCSSPRDLIFFVNLNWVLFGYIDSDFNVKFIQVIWNTSINSILNFVFEAHKIKTEIPTEWDLYRYLKVIHHLF